MIDYTNNKFKSRKNKREKYKSKNKTKEQMPQKYTLKN